MFKISPMRRLAGKVRSLFRRQQQPTEYIRINGAAQDLYAMLSEADKQRLASEDSPLLRYLELMSVVINSNDPKRVEESLAELKRLKDQRVAAIGKRALVALRDRGEIQMADVRDFFPLGTAVPRKKEIPEEAQRIIRTYSRQTPVDELSLVLFEAWCKADPESAPAQHPAGYLATFADLARAVLIWQEDQVLRTRMERISQDLASRHDLDAEPPSEDELAELDARMKAAGMIPASDLLRGDMPLERWIAHAGVNDMDSFEQWLSRRHREFMTMRMAYELGDKGKEDELYEWVLAHCGALGEVMANFRAAKTRMAEKQDAEHAD
mgnify:CR=1 FL=1